MFSEALGRTIRYRDVPLAGWSELLGAGVPAHIVKHLSVMTELNKQGRYDRMTDDLFKLTGQAISMYDFVKRTPLNSHPTDYSRYSTTEAGHQAFATPNPLQVLWSSRLGLSPLRSSS